MPFFAASERHNCLGLGLIMALVGVPWEPEPEPRINNPHVNWGRARLAVGKAISTASRRVLVAFCWGDFQGSFFVVSTCWLLCWLNVLFISTCWLLFWLNVLVVSTCWLLFWLSVLVISTCWLLCWLNVLVIWIYLRVGCFVG